MRRLLLILLALVLVGALGLALSLRPSEDVVQETRPVATPALLEAHCADHIGPPRVEQLGERVFVAIGYDLANTTLIRTDEGAVVVDVGMSPSRAAPMREALLAASPGPVRALVFTHSHIDHVGGASVWVDGEDGPVDIWATESFTEHFFKQYGVFRPAETVRGARQFGLHVDEESVPCSALGRRIDLVAALETGVRMPTKTFAEETSFTLGGVRFDLVEAHGETHDQLFVHVPELGALLPGDNWYRAFPNLYTIRGTTPRPADAWIASLDAMRARGASVLVPSHTVPVEGEAEVAAALTSYRDGIQWVRDQTIRGANALTPVDELAAATGLPEGVAGDAALAELYGQIDWSVRALFANELGWFDGRPETLYPPEPSGTARRTVEMMGGADAVRAAAVAARAEDPRWSVHLLALLRDAGEGDEELAASLRALAATVPNTNGRGYLLESAHELEHGRQELAKPRPGDALVEAIPVALLFEVMQSRLIPERAGGVHESLEVAIEESGVTTRYHVTVRNRVAELWTGEPLPGTPAPVAVLATDAATWRRVALGQAKPAPLVASGALRIEGSEIGLKRFLDRFERGI